MASKTTWRSLVENGVPVGVEMFRGGFLVLAWADGVRGHGGGAMSFKAKAKKGVDAPKQTLVEEVPAREEVRVYFERFPGEFRSTVTPTYK
jgi:hypothetical protein